MHVAYRTPPCFCVLVLICRRASQTCERFGCEACVLQAKPGCSLELSLHTSIAWCFQEYTLFLWLSLVPIQKVSLVA